MLVLTRKPGETIQIGNDIVLTILEVCGERVRVGIVAPDDVTILRGELAEWQNTPQTAPSKTRRPAHAAS